MINLKVKSNSVCSTAYFGFLLFEIDDEKSKINHFTVVCSVTWPLYSSEDGSDLVLIKTSLLCK